MADLFQRKPDGSPLLHLADVCNINEALIVDGENQKRAYDAATKRNGTPQPGRRR